MNGPSTHVHSSASAPSTTSTATTGVAHGTPSSRKIAANACSMPPLKLIASRGIVAAIASVASTLSAKIVASASPIAFGKSRRGSRTCST